MQANGNRVFGVDKLMLLCGISALLTGVSLIFNKKVVCKQKEEKK